jgi:flavin reductase (DIM6/NTAB) family NADH-FMN oxidoreductase RutF
MLPEKMKEVLTHEGVVAIVTQGEKEPHVVNTWNTFIQVTGDERLLVPVGDMEETEANIAKNNKVQVTMGSREVKGLHSEGAGFLVIGAMTFLKEGREFDLVKDKHPWARAAGEIKINNVIETL